jgi:hypothetical protein
MPNTLTVDFTTKITYPPPKKHAHGKIEDARTKMEKGGVAAKAYFKALKPLSRVSTVQSS